MRWSAGVWVHLTLVSALLVVGAPGCAEDPGGDGAEDGDDEGDTGGAVNGPDYGGCSQLRDPTCLGPECASDPDAVPWIELFQAEIASRGLADRLLITGVDYSASDSSVSFDLMAEVGWYRTSNRLPFWGGLPTDQGQDAFMAEVNDFLDQVEMPATVIDFEVVEQAFDDCHPELAYDPCESNGWNFQVYDNVTWMPELNCVEDVATLRIFVGTGEIVCDPDPPEVGCG